MPNFVGFLRLATTGALAVLLSFGGGGAAGALYDVSPGEIPGKPGSIIRIWPLEGGGPGMRGTEVANCFCPKTFSCLHSVDSHGRLNTAYLSRRKQGFETPTGRHSYPSLSDFSDP